MYFFVYNPFLFSLRSPTALSSSDIKIFFSHWLKVLKHGTNSKKSKFALLIRPYGIMSKVNKVLLAFYCLCKKKQDGALKKEKDEKKNKRLSAGTL